MKTFKIFLALLILSAFSYAKAPCADPIQIIKVHQPLKDFLKKNNKDKIEIFSAKSYGTKFELIIPIKVAV